MGKVLIIKEKQIQINANEEYMIIKTPNEERVIAYQHIEKIYVKLYIKIAPSSLQLLQKVFDYQYTVGNGYRVYERF